MSDGFNDLTISLMEVFFGKIKNEKNEGLKDLGIREIIVMLPILVMIVWIGVYPKPFLKIINNASRSYIEYVKPKPFAQPLQVQNQQVVQPVPVPPQQIRMQERMK